MSDCHRLLAGFPVVMTIPVLWGDEDAFGHVNNVAYLRWCEAVRVEYLRRISLFPELPPSGAAPILASVQCDYKLPLTNPDTVYVGTRVTRIGNSSITMEHHIVSRNLDKVAARAVSIMVVFDYSRNQPVPVSAELRKTIGGLEGKSFERQRQR